VKARMNDAIIGNSVNIKKPISQGLINR